MARLRTDIVWAWRGIRRRKLVSVAHVLLVALAVATSAVAFSATDSFLFNRAPYPNASRLVVFERLTPVGVTTYLSFAEYEALRARTDLFAAMYGHGMGANLYLTAGGVMRGLRVQEVEPGVFEALGVRPVLGRTLVDDDARATAGGVVVIAEDLAFELFGSPAAALGKTLEGSPGGLHIVGVMPAAFRFPTAMERIWRASESVRPAAGKAVSLLAVLATGATFDAVDRAVAEYTRATIAADAVPGPFAAVPLARAQHDPRAYTNFGGYSGVDAPRLFSTLLVAAICLALVVCLNLAGLELAAALTRAPVLATLTALGATRASLVRALCFESAALTLAGAAAGSAVAIWGTSALAAIVPAALESVSTNPVDLDARALTFIAAIAVVASVLIALPVVWFVSRPGHLPLSRGDARPASTRISWSLRHALVTSQVALAVLLLAAGVLFVRTYMDKIRTDKGFDSRLLAAIEVAQPRGAARPNADLERDVLDRLRGYPGVVAISRAGGLPPYQRGGSASHVWIDGQAAPSGQVAFRTFNVDPDTLQTMGLPLRRGRGIEAADAATQVVVDEDFARRFWSSGDAVGARFSLGTAAKPGRTVYDIVGVAARVRLDASDAPMGGEYHVMHRRLDGKEAPLTFVARLASEDVLASVSAATRDIARTAIVRTGWMDERYAHTYGGARIAAALTGVFAVAALVVVAVGLYSVTAFLVAGRRREIGIRLALGAEARHIRRVVATPAVRAMALGAGIGVGVALFAARIVDSQLSGVTSADPSTYAIVVAMVIVTTAAATWRPVRRALRLDPARTLRAE